MASVPKPAPVIPLFQPRSCWDCYYHQDIADATGVSSRCDLFDESIAWEGQAADCDGYENNPAR